MRWLSFVGVLLLVGCGAALRPPPAPSRKTTMELGFSSYTMPSGLKVVLVRDPMAAEVQVTTRYAVGSSNDPAEHGGMAHLVEHLMFQLTLDDKSLFAHLETLATQWNAFTSYDATTYVSRAEPANLDKLLAIEAARMSGQCASIRSTAFEREREVVVQEAKLFSGFDEVRFAVAAAMYPEAHPYRRRTRGSVESVHGITHEQACSFIDAHYAPNNAVVVVAGPISREDVRESVNKFLGGLAARKIASDSRAPDELPAGQFDVPGPLDRDVLVLSWRIPRDPAEHAQITALTPMVISLIDQQIRGRVIPFPLGDTHFARLTLAIVPAADETIAEVREGVRVALDMLPDRLGATQIPALDAFQFDTIRQSAVYGLMSSLEDGTDRDFFVATEALSGRDPEQTLTAAANGLVALGPQTAAELARTRLSLAKARVITLTARTDVRQATSFPASPPTYDIGLGRDVDANAANQPVTGSHARTIEGMQSRVLPNGLRVVLLPLTSVGTLDIRLIFHAGSGDDGDKPGAALVAAKALSWHPRYANDLLQFIRAGGTNSVEVGLDHTTFSARGIDIHLDVLLAGLRRWVRDGMYDFNNQSLAQTVRRMRKQVGDDELVEDAMRAAVFGDDHPYRRAGLMYRVSEEMTPADAERFRATRFTPDNATLVIAGSFDSKLADRWIDFLFADWRGTAERRSAPKATPHPETFLQVGQQAQLRLQMALPARASARAQRLIAAEMLDAIVKDVRHQLGASYVFGATLVEARLATDYQIDGWVDASRVADVVGLLRDRIAQLRNDAAASSVAFVLARRRVLTRLRSTTRSAAALADRVERDISLGREPMSDLETAVAVEQTTIEQMGAALSELDLANATIAVRGPEAETNQALALLSRTPKRLEIDRAALAALEKRPLPKAVERANEEYEFAAAITQQPGPPHMSLALTAGFASAHVGQEYAAIEDTGTSGVSIAGELATRMTGPSMVGLHAGLGYLSGDYRIEENVPVRHDGEHITADMLGFVQLLVSDRVWLSVLLGIHGDRTHENPAPNWYMGIAGGLEAAVDVVRREEHRIGLTLRYDRTLLSNVDYSGFTLGLTYRYY